MIRRPPRSTRTDTLFPYTTLFRSLPEILGGAGIALVGLRAVNNDVIGLCFLDLKRFVDQIAENLQAQPFLLLLFHLSAIGSDDERQPLVDIRPRDDLTIDNGGGFADIGIALAEQRDIRGDVEIVGWRGVRIGGLRNRS